MIFSVKKSEKILLYIFFPLFLVIFCSFFYLAYEIYLVDNYIKFLLLYIIFTAILILTPGILRELKFIQIVNYSVEIDGTNVSLLRNNKILNTFSLSDVSSITYDHPLFYFNLPNKRITTPMRLNNYENFLDLLLKNYKPTLTDEELYAPIKKQNDLFSLRNLYYLPIILLLIFILFFQSFIFFFSIAIALFIAFKYVFNIIREIKLSEEKIYLKVKKELLINKDDIQDIQLKFMIYKRTVHYIEIVTSTKIYSIDDYEANSWNISLIDLYRRLHYWKFKI